MANSAVHIASAGAVALSSRVPSHTGVSPASSSLSSSAQRCSWRSISPGDGIGRRESSSLGLPAECRRWGAGIPRRGGGGGGAVRVEAQAGASAMLAKEMERVAAKEALLLSIGDAGGLKGLSDAAAMDKARIDVNEKILMLERLNPTPRPTTSPVLEGLWRFEWAGAQSPGIVAAKSLILSLPSGLAAIESLTLLILDESAEARGFIKLFNTLESSFTLITKLTVEGPLRLKESYAEGFVSRPTLPEGTVPQQLKGYLDQINSAVELLPDAIKEVFKSGVKFPLTNTFSRELLISYLDDEVLVARDKAGAPDVLLRSLAPILDSTSEVVVPEYLS